MGLLDTLIGNSGQSSVEEARKKLVDILLEEEDIKLAFKSIRDFYVFTDWRIVFVDVQGLTGKKVEYMSLPYRSITSFSVETAGTFDADAELRVWVAGHGEPIKKSVNRKANVKDVQRAIAQLLSPY